MMRMTNGKALAAAILASLVLVAKPILAGSSTTAEEQGTTGKNLLDDRPNVFEVLGHQWSADLPEDILDDQRVSEHYGGLGDTTPQVTSLPECIGLAIQNNTDLRIQNLGPENAAANVRRAYSQFDPRLFADTRRDRRNIPATSTLTSGLGAASQFDQNFSFNAGLRKTLLSGGNLSLAWTNNRNVANPSIINVLVPRYTTTLGLQLNQPLLRDFGWRYALLLVDIAQNTEQVAILQYRAALSTLVAGVERSYWLLVASIQSVRVQEQSLTLAQELLRQNEGKFNVGSLPRTAVLEAQAEVARRESNLIRVRNLTTIARDNLRALINAKKDGGNTLLAVDPTDDPRVETYNINLQRSMDTAREHRPELQAARLDLRGRGLARKVAENQLLPRLNLLGEIGVNGISGSRPDVNNPFYDRTKESSPLNPKTFQGPANLEGGYGSALDLLPDGRYYNYAIGATIEIPIANAQARADYSKASIDVEQSNLGLRKLEESVSLEIKTAVSNLETDLKSIEATRIARELAEENVRNQKARYDVGLATTKDLLDFQDKLTQARFSEVEALTKYNIDLAEMRRVEGSILEARNVIVERRNQESAPWWASF